MRPILAAALLAVPAAALAQAEPPIRGTRLEVSATGETERVPDLARVGVGVVTTGATASAAVAQNAERMAAVRAALRRAGIADRDIQTGTLSLSPESRDDQSRAPQITGYRASNEVTVTFHDVASAGRLLDAMVAVGANQITGPLLTVEHPQPALDEARVKALAIARSRAELYARAAGKHVGRIVAILETGSREGQGTAMGYLGAGQGSGVEPGVQTLSVTLTVTFELD